MLRKRLICGVMACLLAGLVPVSIHAAGGVLIGAVEVPAEVELLFDAALLMERSTDTVVYTKEAEKIFTPTGGAVNLMTAYIVMQTADIELEIPIIDAVNELSSNVRKIDLVPGKRWPIKDLLAAMLLHGAQDAALVLCDHVSGSQEAFITLMNEYAIKLGMSQTVYTNALGAYEEGQQTTASDLAILAEAVLSNDFLRELLGKNAYDTLAGKTIKNRMEIMQEDRTSYDARVRGIGEGSTASSGTNTLLYAVDGDWDWLFIGYTEVSDQVKSEESAIALIDHISDGYGMLDLTEYVKGLLNNQSLTAADGSVTVAALPEDSGSVKLVAGSSSIDALTADPSQFALGELPALDNAPAEGTLIGTVVLLYGGETVAVIDLVAAAVTLPEPVVETEPAEPEQTEKPENDDENVPVYTAEDWPGYQKEPTLTQKYGCFIIIGAAFVLAALVIIVVYGLRKARRI